MEVINVRRYKVGYEIRTEQLTEEEAGGIPGGMVIKSAYTTDGGHYIGTSRWAHRLMAVRGIKPELAKPDHKTCSIGFCSREQKWYGWSHRAMFGFGIGHMVKKGDCGYRPGDISELVDSLIDEGVKPNLIEITEKGVRVTHVMIPVASPIPTDTSFTVECEPQYQTIDLGRGEWTAKTLEDCKQMAIDFAEGVS